MADVVEGHVEEHAHPAALGLFEHGVEGGVTPAGVRGERLGSRGVELGRAGLDARPRERGPHVHVVADRVGRAEVVAGRRQVPAVVGGEERHEPDRVRADGLVHVADRDGLARVGGVDQEVVEGAEPDALEARELRGRALRPLGAVRHLGGHLRLAGAALLRRAPLRVAGVGRARLQLVEHEFRAVGRPAPGPPYEVRDIGSSRCTSAAASPAPA